MSGMSTNLVIGKAILAIVITVGLVVVGVVWYSATSKDPEDPDHFKSPYYALSYKESYDVKTLKHLYNGTTVTTAPTGIYTDIEYTKGYDFPVNNTLGDGEQYMWWDVTVEIYAAPNIYFGNGTFKFVHDHLKPHNITDERFIKYGWYASHTVIGGVGGHWTDDKGRATITFTIGVYADQVYAGFISSIWGEPRTVTKL